MNCWTASFARGLASNGKINYNLALFIISLIIALYVVYGGLIAVIYTDAFQGLIMLFSMAFLLIATYSALGGIPEAHIKLTAFNDVAVKLFHESGKIVGHIGWTSSPAFGTPAWLIVVTTLILGVGIGVLAQPQLAVRLMTVKDDRDLDRAVPIGSFFVFMMTGTAFIVGALSNAYFLEKYGKPSIAMAGGNVDKIIPVFINEIMPEWFVAIFMVTLLAAAMSTLSSQFHTIGSALGRDILQAGILKGKRAEKTILITRIAISFGILFSIVLAYRLPPSVIARGTAIFFALCASSFLPAYLGGLYWKRATSAGAKASVVFGFTGSLLYLTFIKVKEAKELGICKAIFGVDSLAQYPFTHIDPLVIILPISTLIFITVSLITSKKEAIQVRTESKTF